MPRIIALGGGGFSDDPLDEHGRGLDQCVLDATNTASPRLCFIGTASGDAESYTLKFYRAFEGRARLEELDLTLRPRHPRLREFVLGMDAVYVGGGSTLNMLAVWRAHGLDDVLREAYERGVVLSGISAGMICWFEQAATDSFSDGLRPIDGLGLLAGSACAHFGDLTRREQYLRLVADGLIAAGYGADDGVALDFEDGVLREAISCDAAMGAKAYRVGPAGMDEIPVRHLHAR
jgi:dipeptidase E